MDKEKISAHTYAAIRAFWRQRNERFSIMISFQWCASFIEKLHYRDWTLKCPLFKLQIPTKYFSLSYTALPLPNHLMICRRASVLALCHFNGALCQFGSYGWHWLYNTLCVIIQNCLMNKHQAVLIVLKIVYFKMPKKTFVLRLISFTNVIIISFSCW